MKTITTCLLLLGQFAGNAATLFIAAPNSLDQAQGNSTHWPFTLEEFGIHSRRYQQVYDASQFNAIRPQGGYVTHLLFREGAGPPGDTSEYLPSVEISLGITSAGPDRLSPVFADNIGPIYSRVYASSLEVWTGGMAAPWSFITLAQPFFYTPAAGNLLLDIRTFASGGPNDINDLPGLDSEETLGDSISIVVANDVNALSGLLSTDGLVTGFLFEPIPEPGTWALLELGLLGMWRFLRRNNNSQNNHNKKRKG